MIVSLVGPEIGVGRFVGDVDEIGEAEVLHLPGVAPVARVVPLSVEALGGDPEVEVLRHHAGIDVDGGCSR